MISIGTELYETVVDMIKNKPTDMNGEPKKYSDKDIAEYKRIICEIKDNIEYSKSKMSNNCYDFLMKICSEVSELLNNRTV